MSNNSMKPVDVGAPELIPMGNLNPNHPASFAGLRKELDSKQHGQFVSRTSAYTGFKPGYSGGGLEGLAGEWQQWRSSALK